MKLRSEQLADSLKKELAPLYYISGDEALLLQECGDLIRQAANQQGYDERELHHADNNFDWSLLHHSAHSLSLFGQKKLIEIRLPAKLNDKGRKALVEYAEKPAADTVVLLIGPKVERSSQSAKWFKTLEAAGRFVQVWPVTPSQMPRWIQQRARRLGLDLEPPAVDLLVSRVEGNLLAAAQELEKLNLLSDDGKVDVHLMSHAVADSARYDVYHLVDIALHGDARHAVKTLHGLKGEGTEITIVLWALTREIRTLLQLKQELDAGKNFAGLARQYRVWQNRQPLVQNALRRLKKSQLQNLLRRAGQVDRAIKGMHASDPWEGCIEIVLNLTGIQPLVGDSERLALKI